MVLCDEYLSPKVNQESGQRSRDLIVPPILKKKKLIVPPGPSVHVPPALILPDGTCALDSTSFLSVIVLSGKVR